VNAQDCTPFDFHMRQTMDRWRSIARTPYSATQRADLGSDGICSGYFSITSTNELVVRRELDKGV
jgi:hypothetical protein